MKFFSMERNLARRAAAAGAAVFAAALLLYYFTSSPGLPPGHDSAELTAASACAGIAHPPGYPLYVMTANIFMRLLPCLPVRAANIHAAFFGALAMGTAAAAFTLFTGSAAIGSIAALMATAARTPWRMSVGAEVFSLHLFICSLLFLLAAMWREAEAPRRGRLVIAMAFVLGLGLAHHQTIVLILPGLAIYMYFSRADRGLGFSWKSAAALAVGLAPYLWLPFRANQHPAVNWGAPDTFEKFFWCITRSGYGGVSLSTAQGAPAYGEHFWRWLKSLCLFQFPIFGCLAGVAALWKKRPELWLFGGLFLLSGPVWVFIAAQPGGDAFADMLERFYAASDLSFAGLIALGLAYCRERWPRFFAGKAFLVLGIALILGTISVNYQASSERNQELVSKCADIMVYSIPKGALVVTASDLTSGIFMYENAVLGKEYIHIPAGISRSEWFIESLPDNYADIIRRGGLPALMLYARAQGMPVYTDFASAEIRGFFIPEGLMYRWIASFEPIPERSACAAASLNILDSQILSENYKYSSDRPFWCNYLISHLKSAYIVAADGLRESDPSLAEIAYARARAFEVPEMK